MRKRPPLFYSGLVMWMVGTLSASVCQAQGVYSVRLDTSPLMAASAGPFAIDFQLLDGSGLGDANETVSLGDFQFGAGGSASGSPTLLGGAAGDLSSTVTLTDSSFLSELSQPFTAGETLRFTLQVTGNMDAGVVGDQFAFAVLDGSGAALPTFGPGDALLTVDLATGSVQTFGTSPAAAVSLGAPTVTAVPEPTALSLLLSGCLALTMNRRRKLRARRG